MTGLIIDRPLDPLNQFESSTSTFYELACKSYPPSYNIYTKVLSKAKQRDEYPMAFSHVAFNSTQVILDPVDGTLEGVLGWEMAGWYPAYWERRKIDLAWLNIISALTVEYFEGARDQTLVDFQGI